MLVQFGAGKIGRSFIAQLFARSGYRVTFVDIDEKILKELNCPGDSGLMYWMNETNGIHFSL